MHIGRYEVLSRFALGGMAELLLGRVVGPSGFERVVAIKRILPHFAEQPSFVQMFLEEGRVAARIAHPNVVQVFELAKEGADLYLVMEYLTGESLAGVLRRMHARALRLTPALAAYVVASAAAGLHAAHELKDASGRTLGVVHRDVSPQNIFVTYDGVVKVLDFGIAKAADRVTMTEQGTLKGKIEYMSPEQARGELVDRRSDVFGLGVVLHELLTGRRLFRRVNPVASWNAVCNEPIPPPSLFNHDCPAALDAICARALDRDRRTRVSTALELRRMLLQWIPRGTEQGLPEELLAGLMGSLFAERIVDKHRVVEQLRGIGPVPAKVPTGEVDLSIDLPSVVEPSPTAVRAEVVEVQHGPRLANRALRVSPELPASKVSPDDDDDVGLEPTHARGRRSQTRTRWVVAGALLLGLAGAAGVAATLLGGGSDQAPGAVEAVNEPLALDSGPGPAAEVLTVPPGPTPETPAPPDVVAISIETAPAGAVVTLNKVPRGVTPTALEVPRSTEALELRLDHAGHEPLVEQVIPNVQQRLKYVLRRTPPARRAPRPPPSPTETPPPPPPEEPQFRRFN